MWSDNETTHDLLGFKVHIDLIRSVVTDSDLLPVVIGVFGDWGGGKSSIMRMLEAQLKADEEKADAERNSEAEDGEAAGAEVEGRVVCLYFNGWMFEGYEDAKTALLTSILVALGEHKHLKVQLKEKVTGLLRRVQWMDAGKALVKHVGVPLVAGALTGGTATIPAFLGSLIPTGAPTKEKEPEDKGEKKDDKDETNWLGLIKEAPGEPDLLEVRKFRDEFEQMLAQTKIRSLVILIDDLDRCLPPRIIETLEAIKLFVSVPKTAFVIGADERIIRHAIADRYARQQLDMRELESQQGAGEEREKPYDLITDYLEKLIQIPYHLPRLAPAEMETYINLLLCHKYLLPGSAPVYHAMIQGWNDKRESNFYAAFNYGEVIAALGDENVPPELRQQLVWSNHVARPLSEGLKGNPRQVKRMLNAMLLRTRLAGVARLDIRAEVLAKLMVLEYTRPELFRALSDWQTASEGRPPQLKKLEDAAAANEKLDEFGDWQRPGAQNWLRMEPLDLAAVDLRDYFWIARDRTKSTLAAASMVSPHINALYRQLIGGNEGDKEIAADQAKELEGGDVDSLLTLLQQHVVRHPDDDAGSEALALLIARGVEGAPATLFNALRQAPADTMSPSIPLRLQIIASGTPALEEDVQKMLEHLASKAGTDVGRAALEATQSS